MNVKRFLKINWIIFLFFYTNMAFAVGFGEIKLFSYLNEPLSAEIELLGTESYDADRLMVALGSAQEFKRAGLERPFFLSQLKFEVRRLASSRTFIKIWSKEAIKQPYLEFLLDLSWPGGRLVRGYTLLLDPAPIQRSNELHEKRASLHSNVNNSASSLNESLEANNSKQLETLFDTESKSHGQELPLPPMTVVSHSKPPITHEPHTTQAQSEEQGFNSDSHLNSNITAKHASNPNQEVTTIHANATTNIAEGSTAIGSLSEPIAENRSEQNSQNSLGQNPNKPDQGPAQTLANSGSTFIPPFSSNTLQINFTKQGLILAVGGFLFLLIPIGFFILFIMRRKKQLTISAELSEMKPKMHYWNKSKAAEDELETQGLKPPIVLQSNQPGGRSSIIDAGIMQNSENLSRDLTSELPYPDPDKMHYRPLVNELSLKLELAHHYLAIGDNINALPLINDVMLEGSETERHTARQLLYELESQKSS